LPNDAISYVLLHVDSLTDVRQLFRTCRHLASFAPNRRLSLMWIDKHHGMNVAFTQALALGDRAFARDMIPRMTSSEKMGFLRTVVEQGMIPELVAPLLDPATDINAGMGFMNRRWLHCASTGGVAAALLAVDGIDVNATDVSGSTPLHTAVEHGRYEVVAVLIAANGIDVNAKMLGGGCTALHLAVTNNHVAIIELLREAQGIDVNAQGRELETPLHMAASREAVRALAAFPGIDLNPRKRYGYTPLQTTMRSLMWEAFKELVVTPGVDVNATTDGSGMTSLHTAVIYGRLDAVNALLAAPGINVNAQNMLGETPLQIAARLGRQNMIARLIAFSDSSHPWSARWCAQCARRSRRSLGGPLRAP
jgi:ankyrin repeat protein